MSGMNFLERLLDGAAVEWKPLGEIGELVRGNGLPKTDFTESGVPAIHYGQIYTYYGLSTTSTKSFVSPETATKLRKVDKGDVVITNTSENLEDVGKALFYFGDQQAVTGGHATIFKPCKNILGKYFAYFTQTVVFTSEKRKYAKGTKVIDVSATDMAKIPIPIPCPDNPDRSLAIQAEIVRILDTFTELTAELTAELSDRKKQYNYYRDRLLTFEEGEVEWKTLGEVTRIFSASRVHKNEWTTSGVPFYRTSDVISIFNGVKNSRDAAFISNELYETLSSKSGKIQKGDVLVTGGGTIGIPYIVQTDEPLYFKDADLLCIQKSEVINSKFLYHYFLTTKFRIYLNNITHNATISHYTISQIVNTPVPLPPIEEQARIVAILDKFDTLTHSISEGLPREIALRQKQYEYYRDLLLSFPPPLTPP